MTSAINNWGSILRQLFSYITSNVLLGSSVFILLIMLALNIITIIYKNSSKVK